ncbi:MAG: NAD-dependent epimerase/dehydratase family protein [Bacteroidetes bacterium]|nr:NAD-dependent epimerase/dehydratase family protein [Bacteroidota bacterium]MDA1268003.1 NAD-dependent epimerase/dehydratase family protein [Bacteroidota bacterium]
MNILITGVTGLFGSELAREFSTLGNIHGLRRASSDLGAVDLEGLDIQWHEGDVLDFNSLLEAVEGMDVVIHAAGKVSFLPQEERALFQINHQGTVNVVNALLATSVPKLVYISSVAVLGQVPDQEEYDEKSVWLDLPNPTAYALSKYKAELEVWRGEQEGLEVLVVNPAVILGKVAYDRSSGALYQVVLKGTAFFPAGNINYIDVRDAAEITRALVEKNAWGERFVLSKESIPYEVFFQLAAQVLGGVPPKNKLPNWVISWGFPILRGLSWMIGKRLPLTAQVAKIAQCKTHFSNQKVERYLNFHYRELRDTLEWAKMGR